MFEKVLTVEEHGRDRIFLYDKGNEWIYDKVGDAPVRAYSKVDHLLPPYITDPSQMKTKAAKLIVSYVHNKHGVNHANAINA
jgi:hypothetical protein